MAAAVALSALPGMGPRRLRAVLDAWPPTVAWQRIRRGGADPEVAAIAGRTAVAASWAGAAAAIDATALLDRHRALGINVELLGGQGYPARLAEDREPPVVVFWVGDLAALEEPAVALVGTRRCTGVGASIAHELGRDLSAAGVAVVSGLALGIDGAAHRGALVAAGAAPVGVVANGLDAPYPPRHRALWRAVAERGLLLGEAPVGAPPAAWRFPARNRIIAACAELVVVVESHARGGAMHTVEEAVERGIEVMAVPGSPRNPAAAGANRLLHEGCGPVRSALDVLGVLGRNPPGPRPALAARPPPGPSGASVLDALGWEPATFEHLAARTRLPLAELGLALDELVDLGWVTLAGGWYEQAGDA